MKKALIVVLIALTLSACAAPGTATVVATTTVTAAPSPEGFNPTVPPDADAQVATYQTYVDHINEFTPLNDAIQSASSLDDFATGCRAVSRWADDGLALADIGIPDADMHWDAAMRLYAEGSDLCVKAAKNGDPDKAERASTLIRRGADEIEKATEALGEAAS